MLLAVVWLTAVSQMNTRIHTHTQKDTHAYAHTQTHTQKVHTHSAYPYGKREPATYLL